MDLNRVSADDEHLQPNKALCVLSPPQQGGGGRISVRNFFCAIFRNISLFLFFLQFFTIAFGLSSLCACWCPLPLHTTVAEQSAFWGVSRTYGGFAGHQTALSHEEVKPDVESTNRFPLFSRFELVSGPPVQKCCSLRLPEVWLWHLIFPAIFRNWIGPSLIASPPPPFPTAPTSLRTHASD